MLTDLYNINIISLYMCFISGISVNGGVRREGRRAVREVGKC